MGDLNEDTAVEGGDGQWRAVLNRDWEIWGPNGGYMAAVAMRAAGAHSSLPRPASLLCQFLGVAEFDEVQITTTTLRSARRAEALSVQISQGDRPIMAALVWMTAENLDGLAHATVSMPPVAHPDELHTLEELAADDNRPPFRFWENLHYKPLEWMPPKQWEQRPAGDGTSRAWISFRPTSSFDDPCLNAGRLLVAVDTFGWPAALRAHTQSEMTYMAPSLDLSCSFHAIRPSDEWLLVDASSPTAGEGLIGAGARIWGTDGTLLASGGQQLLCRPVPSS